MNVDEEGIIRQSTSDLVAGLGITSRGNTPTQFSNQMIVFDNEQHPINLITLGNDNNFSNNSSFTPVNNSNIRVSRPESRSSRGGAVPNHKEDDDDDEGSEKSDTPDRAGIIVLEDESTVPDWFSLNLGEIYEKLNPRTDKDKQRQTWRKKVIDVATGRCLQIGSIANALLNDLVSKKFLENKPENERLQRKTRPRTQQKLDFMNMYDPEEPRSFHVLGYVQTFLNDKMRQPTNVDGDVVEVSQVSINLGCRAIMLAVDFASLQLLSSIFAAPTADTNKRSQIDDKANSFQEKWNELANDFFNAKDFQPENEWGKKDDRINDIDPRTAPTKEWTGEQLRKFFRVFKSKFALADDSYSATGNYSGGNDCEEADKFVFHINKILGPKQSVFHKVLLYAWWVFDKEPPSFINRLQPPENQFDSSDPTLSVAASHVSRKEKKKMQVVDNNAEKIASAVLALAPDVDEVGLKKRCMDAMARESLSKSEYYSDQNKRQQIDFDRQYMEGVLASGVELDETNKRRLVKKYNDELAKFLDK